VAARYALIHLRSSAIFRAEMQYHACACPDPRTDDGPASNNQPTHGRRGMLWVISCTDKPNTAATSRRHPAAAPRITCRARRRSWCSRARRRMTTAPKPSAALRCQRQQPRGGEGILERRSLHASRCVCHITITRMRKGQSESEAAEARERVSSGRGALDPARAGPVLEVRFQGRNHPHVSSDTERRRLPLFWNRCARPDAGPRPPHLRPPSRRLGC